MKLSTPSLSPARSLPRWFLPIFAAFTCGAALGRAAENPVRFSRDILPLLSDNCFRCHGPDEAARKAKLRLDSREDAYRVKDGQAVIAPGNSAASELYHRLVTEDEDDLMPPPSSNHKLSAQQIALIKRWIDEGATWGEHWAFERLTRPQPPEPARFADRVSNPIDRFVFKRLEQEGLAPAPEAPRETLIRRLTLDLTGLPPTPDEVDAFTRDTSIDAYEKIVERLLKSPAFGERMAWEWLDAARYADSNGYQGDSDRTMWPWRDWVVEALNRNLPHDQFSTWQLAGDLLPDPTPEQRIATGFNRNHMINGEGGRIPEENRVDYVMDMAETFGTVWLGLTFNCCRCHDHKYDPLTKRDYYGLFAFFNQTPVDGSGGDPQSKPNVELATGEQRQRLRALALEIEAAATRLEGLEKSIFPRAADKSAADSEAAAALPDNLKTILKTAPGKRGGGQLGELEKHWEKTDTNYVSTLKALRQPLESQAALNRAIVRVMVMADMPNPRETYLLDKGLYDKRGETVPASVPGKLPPLPAGAPPNRLGLAHWLFEPENPLTARVLVSRFWQQFFGVGLVKTTENFGVQGERPVHPELLDWLASEFSESGWDVKYLCRSIVTSATYRQSSRVPAQLAERDPENRLLARGPRFRLPSWMIRDQALAASGLLVRKVGGRPVKPYQPSGVWEEATFGARKYQPDQGENLYRRSLYTFWRRIVGPTLFFDTAPRQVCSVKQPRTNTPLHALTTLNDVTYVEAARALAERVLVAAPANDLDRLDLVFRLVLARPPHPPERQILLNTLARLRTEYAGDSSGAEDLLAVGEHRRNQALPPAEHAAWAGVCAAILNLDETLTKE